MLISSGQPSLNPRLVKEAGALAEAGYTVTVLYQYWNQWATEYDKVLLPAKKWDSIKVGGSPDEKGFTYNLSKIKQKISVIATKTLGFKFGIAERAIGRCTSLLYKEAIKHPADLYIAHNLAALPAAVKAAKKHNAKCGFDAEDYHRNEVSNDAGDCDVRLKTFIEQKYIPLTDYVTAASLQIANQYQAIFPGKEITTILNVFPKISFSLQNDYKAGDILKLFWFSQTVGANRGIEEIIKSMTGLGELVQLHLLGECSDTEKLRLIGLARINGFEDGQLQFHAPVHPDELFNFAAQFHVGIASETGFPLNRDLCLTNKIFTYLQCGLAVVASDTIAQTAFLTAHSSVGKIYPKSDQNALSAIIKAYMDNPRLLKTTRQAAYDAGQNEFNWETESKKFLSVIKETLSN